MRQTYHQFLPFTQSQVLRQNTMKYFGWVLLLGLVHISSLSADAIGTTFGLLPARKHACAFPFFRVRTVRKEYGRCSPQLSNRKSQSATGAISWAVRRQLCRHRNKRHDEQCQDNSGSFKQYFQADSAKL